MLVRNKKIIRNYLIKQLPKATAFVNRKLEIVHASDLWLEVFDLSEDYVIGKHITKLFTNITEDEKIIIKNCFKGVLGKPSIHKFPEINGEKKWFECTPMPWYDEDENIIGAIINIDDVTQRILNEVRLEKLEILLQEKSEIANIGTWEYDLMTDEIVWDCKTKAIHEVPSSYNPTTSEANDFYKNGHSRNTISMAFIEAIKNETPWSEKVKLITAKGNEIWVINSGKPIYTNGEFTSIVGTIQNINEITIKEEKTKENEYFFKTLIDNIPLNIYIKDIDSKKILANKSEIEFHGLSHEDEILGKDDFEFFDREIALELRKEDLGVMLNHKPLISQEMEYKKKGVSIGTFLKSKIPLIGIDQKAYGLIGISMDITDLKQKENKLKKLINVTSLQNEKLINFAHIISHNLRSHSANFSMLIDFLIHEKNQEEKDKITQMLLQSSNNLLDTLENLNEVVEINTNTNLKKKDIFIHESLTKIQQNLSMFLKNNEVEFINTVSPEIKINAIPSYMESILTNLITNAIKYRSEDRLPKIEIQCDSINKQRIITIKDNGIGIDLEKNGDKLFGMYKTFHTNENARGIGLYITKNQIEAMNGKITVESKINKGTTFKLFFNE